MMLDGTFIGAMLGIAEFIVVGTLAWFMDKRRHNKKLTIQTRA